MKHETLAQALGAGAQGDQPVDAPEGSIYAIPEHLTAKEFAKRFLSSVEFRRYLVNSLTLGELPASIVLRMMDYADDWGKPPDVVKHQGDPNNPIVTEIRRVIVRPEPDGTFDAPEAQAKVVTH